MENVNRLVVIALCADVAGMFSVPLAAQPIAAAPRLHAITSVACVGCGNGNGNGNIGGKNGNFNGNLNTGGGNGNGNGNGNGAPQTNGNLGFMNGGAGNVGAFNGL